MIQILMIDLSNDEEESAVQLHRIPNKGEELEIKATAATTARYKILDVTHVIDHTMTTDLKKPPFSYAKIFVERT